MITMLCRRWLSGRVQSLSPRSAHARQALLTPDGFVVSEAYVSPPLTGSGKVMVKRPIADGGWTIATVLGRANSESADEFDFRLIYGEERMIQQVRLGEHNYSSEKAADDMSWVSLAKQGRRRRRRHDHSN